ncbi:unnamed protein product, partial [Prorocentrum cordatum]
VDESTTLFYNMGARHVEACVVRYRGATHAGKPTVSVRVLGCGASAALGGHQVDLVIAEKMLAAFQAKHPQLAEGIASSLRPLKKLEKEAASLKHVLSANKEARFGVESLYEDTDFASPVSRETLEGWTQDMLSAFSGPIEVALSKANTTLEAVDSVEMVGGGWRIPRVQALVSEYLQASRPGLPALNLSQHVNGDEAMATGAAYYGANHSAQFRTKKLFFTDVQHWEANVEKDLQRLTKTKEQVVEFEKAQRESRTRIASAGSEYKDALSNLQAEKAVEDAAAAPSHDVYVKLGGLVSNEVRIGSFIDCDDLFEDLAAAEVDIEKADKFEFENRCSALVAGIQELVQKLFQQVVDSGREARAAHEAHRDRMAAKKRRT